MFIVLIGPPGVGKGTQSRRLARHLGIPHLSTGEMLREACQAGGPFGEPISELLGMGRLVSDQVANEIVDQRLSDRDCRNGCIFDGYPRTLVQAGALDASLAARGQSLGLVVELCADEEELTRRMLQRALTERRSDDSPETIRNRLEVYRTETSPLLGLYQRRGLLHTVDGLGTPDTVYERLCACLPVRENRIV